MQKLIQMSSPSYYTEIPLKLRHLKNNEGGEMVQQLRSLSVLEDQVQFQVRIEALNPAVYNSNLSRSSAFFWPLRALHK